MESYESTDRYRLVNINWVLFEMDEWSDRGYIIRGWVTRVQSIGDDVFIYINDGSCIQDFKLVGSPTYISTIDEITISSCIVATGNIVFPYEGYQETEMHLKNVEVFRMSDPELHELSKKKYSLEFIRQNENLRFRNKLIGAMMRIRGTLTFETHRFYGPDFIQLSSPIITRSNHECGLTLNDEAIACGMNRVYTFGPTLCEGNSNTAHDSRESWRIETQIAFMNLDQIIEFADEYLSRIIESVIQTNYSDLFFLQELENRKVNSSAMTLISRLENLQETPVQEVTYTQAISLLQNSDVLFEETPVWGINLSHEHECWLAEKYIDGPVVITNYPREIKPFYMRNNDDGKTVASMEYIVPGIGKLMSGCQREERLDVVERKIQELGLDLATYEWYLDLCRYRNAPHSGFDVDFDRLVCYVTGLENIHDFVSFPRWNIRN